MPAYNSNVPLANQTVASTQSPIQTNFASIQQTLVVNHEDFNSPNFGKHKFVELPNQTGDPAAAAAEMTIYSKQYNNGVSTQSEAFIKRDAAGVAIPFTAAYTNLSGWTFLPSGLLLKWGQVNYNAPANGTQALSFNFPSGVGTPAFTTIYQAQITLQNNSTLPGVSLGAYIKNILPASLDVEVGNSNGSSQTGNLYYFAIGVGTP